MEQIIVQFGKDKRYYTAHVVRIGQETNPPTEEIKFFEETVDELLVELSSHYPQLWFDGQNDLSYNEENIEEFIEDERELVMVYTCFDLQTVAVTARDMGSMWIMENNDGTLVKHVELAERPLVELILMK